MGDWFDMVYTVELICVDVSTPPAGLELPKTVIASLVDMSGVLDDRFVYVEEVLSDDKAAGAEVVSLTDVTAVSVAASVDEGDVSG